MKARLTNVNPQTGDVLQGTRVIDSPTLQTAASTSYIVDGQHYRVITKRSVTDGSADFEVDVERDRSTE